MSPEEFVQQRLAWGLTQRELAQRLGFTPRSVLDLEMGHRPIRPIHILALERISIEMSLVHKDSSLLMPGVGPAVRRAARLPHTPRGPVGAAQD